ncbi:MAG: glycosyltransferase family 2 protein [Planctomycetia bacterium]|nr:glycosyltransferase family 2 protein [Planctomycetia bacterium]
MTPKVSIIIPVYNVEKYLRQCLDSARNQTMREIEILCVNDGSTDSSGAILDEYATVDSRFVVIHQENAGQSAARNRGLELAQGEYVAFLDSDDWYDLTLCEKVYARAKESQADMTLFLMHFVDFPEKYDYPFQEMENSYVTGEYPKIALIWKAYTVAASTLFRHDFLKKHQLQFLEKYIFEDTYFSLKAAILAKDMAVLNERLYYYRYNPESTTHQSPDVWFKKLDTMDKMIPDLLSLVQTPEARYFIYALQYSTYDNIHQRFTGEMQTICDEKIRRRMTPADWQRIGSYNPQLEKFVRKSMYKICQKKWHSPWIKTRIFFSRIFPQKNLYISQTNTYDA